MTFESRNYQVEYEDDELVPMRPRRRWLEGLLLFGFLLCLVVGLSALAALWSFYRATDSIQTADPLSGFQTSQIMPQLIIMQLAGDPAEALAQQALNAGELETSRALLTYNIQAIEPSRVELLLQLAHRYRDREEMAPAVQLYQMVRAIAILNPSLPSFERAQILVQCSEGLLATEEQAAARDTIEQAKRVTEQAPDLLPIQRSQIFDSLRPLARQLDDNLLTQQIDELARNPFLQPAGGPVHGTFVNLAEPLPFDEALTAAIANRQLRARQLAERILFTKGVDIEPERLALFQALVEEDRLRLEMVNRSLTTGISLGQQFWLLQDQRAWIIQKLRIAQGAFGIALVPEWETNLASLRQELSTVTGRLYDVMNAFANQTTGVDQAMLQVVALNWLALQIEIGFYPDASVDDIGNRLRTAQAQLAQLNGPLALPVAYIADAVPPGFRIQPAN